MEHKPKPFKVKSLGGSQIITIPLDFIHTNDLEPGDYLLLDFSKVKILKAEDFALLGREPVMEVEMAKSA
jgi:hypothetical protein